jgi:ELWxxDGT repeat protein
VFPRPDERALWASDGTSAGTRRLRRSTMNFRGLRRIGASGVALFVDEEPASGRELWRTDGTLAGTHLVFDFHSGTADGGAGVIREHGRTLLLKADDGVHGFEPWVMDLRELRAAFVGSYGAACAGSGGVPPRLAAVGLPQPGRASFAAQLADARPLSPSVLMLSPTRFDLPFGACRVLVDPTTLVLPALTDASGAVRFGLPLPPLRSLRGATVYAQAAVLDGGSAVGLALSAGLELLVGD